MQSNNNINTGLAQKIDAFRWSQSTDNKPHVLGVKVSEPDFSIPPTPASSYANIHVVLDNIHPSSVTRTTSVLPESSRFVNNTALPQYEVSKGSINNRSFSSLPREENLVLNNQLDGIPTRSSRLVPESVDPSQPGARSMPSLTSLKSEIAPVQVPLVPLEEYDDLAERTDRALPPSVDLSLVDETYSFESTYPKKQWALLEEDERSWRMSRPVDTTWKSNWKNIGSELSKKRGSKFGDLEESERQWRMSRPVDGLWTRKIQQVGKELTMFNNDLEDLNQWVESLKVDLAKQSADIIRNVNMIKPELKKITLANLQLNRTLNKKLATDTRALEEKERAYRINRGVDAVFSGKWHQVGLEVISLAGVSWSEWFSNLKDKTIRSTKQAVRKMENVELPSLPQMSMPSLPEMPSMPSMELPSITLPDLKLGVVRSDATLPMIDDSERVDFTFKKNRASLDYISKLEEERSLRMSKGVNPVLYGLWFRIGQELKYKFSLRPTFGGVASKLAAEASDLASKAGNMFESMAESAHDAFTSAKDMMTPAPVVDFAEHKHLNLFAFTAEKIDFTFKKNRTPASIIALEEAERRDRMSRGYDRTRYAKWNSFLLANLPKTSFESTTETMVEKVEKVAEAAVGKVAASSWGSMLGSLVHNVADTTSHFYEVAKDSLHMNEQTPLSNASLSASEEAERIRRMNVKVDPMTAARMGRVQDELLNFSIKSKN